MPGSNRRAGKAGRGVKDARVTGRVKTGCWGDLVHEVCAKGALRCWF